MKGAYARCPRWWWWGLWWLHLLEKELWQECHYLYVLMWVWWSVIGDHSGWWALRVGWCGCISPWWWNCCMLICCCRLHVEYLIIKLQCYHLLNLEKLVCMLYYHVGVQSLWDTMGESSCVLHQQCHLLYHEIVVPTIGKILWWCFLLYLGRSSGCVWS